MILEADELDALQQSIADIYTDTMPDRLFIQRTVAATRDVENPEIISAELTNKVYDQVPCSYREATPREIDLVGSQQKQQLLAIDIAPIYHVQASDSGQIYSKGNTPAVNFEVIDAKKESNATAYTLFAHVV